MADKGFELKADLPYGIELNIPPFLRAKDQLSLKEEEQETRQITSLKTHKECASSRIETFRILGDIFPITMCGNLNKIWIVFA